MITVSVKSNVDAVVRDLERRFRDQVPFAVAKALTLTAKDVQRAEVEEIRQAFDRPTPFTQQAVGITSATKQRLSAKVFVKTYQLAYLGIQVEGGIRQPKRRALVVPVDLPLNQYGNIPRRKVQALLSRRDTFSGRVNGVGGIWQRTKAGPLKLLIAYEPAAKYRKRFPFYEVALRVIDQRFDANLRSAVAGAIATAK